MDTRQHYNRKNQFGPRFRRQKLVSDIVPTCKPVKYKVKLTTLTWVNDENPNFAPNFGP